MVAWLQAESAFTAPGQFIYFSRQFLQRFPDDETTAFVIAHEMAHHDLGHLALFSGRFARHVAHLAPGQLLVLFFRMLQKHIYSPVWECDADRHALELCISAGYEPAKCLATFQLLEMWCLDLGDISGVHGPDRESDRELAPDADFLTKARIWLWQRQRGYLPIRDRAAAVREHLAHLPGLRSR